MPKEIETPSNKPDKSPDLGPSFTNIDPSLFIEGQIPPASYTIPRRSTPKNSSHISDALPNLSNRCGTGT